MLSRNDKRTLYAILFIDIITILCIITSFVLLFTNHVVISFVFMVLSCGLAASSVYMRSDFQEYCKDGCIKIDSFWFKTEEDNFDE